MYSASSPEPWGGVGSEIQIKIITGVYPAILANQLACQYESFVQLQKAEQNLARNEAGLGVYVHCAKHNHAEQ